MSGILQFLLGGGSSAPAATGDPYFQYNTLLLPGQGTNLSNNNTFQDSSSNNFTVFRNGGTTQGTFTPFSEAPGYWSNYFDGNGDFLTYPNNAAIDFGTGDVTIEAWIYRSTTAETNIMAAYPTGGTGFTGWAFTVTSSSQLVMTSYVTGTQQLITAANVIPQNQWTHVAYTRASGTNRIFINGVSNSLTGSLIQAINAGGNPGSIGSTRYTGFEGYFNGYISNARIVKGTAVYTSDFTPSTTPLTAISGTSLLTCQSNRFVDNSTNAFAITQNGGAAVQTFQPFGAPTSAYSAATIGGSGYFDGTGDFLTVADNASLEPGSSDFTIECWIYPTATGSFLGVFSKRTNNATDYSPIQILINSGTMILAASTSGSSWAVNVNASSSPPLNAWSHIAVVRNGTGSNNLVLYLNGVSVATGSVSSTALVNNAGAWAIAADSDDGGGNFAGYICGFRSVIGTAVYTSAFTPPTAPPTAITNTQLLLNYTNAGIIDNAASNNLETVNDVKISTAQFKWGTSSIAFDGTGDYLVQKDTPNLTLGTGDFTIEFWVYYNSGLTADVALFDCRPASTNGVYPLIFSNTTGKIVWYINSAARITGTTTLVTGTWYYVAVSRSASSTKLFINGNQDGSTYADTNNYLLGTNRPLIGAAGATVGADPLNGYVQDLRITKGYARYLYNFTAPTAAFPLFWQAAPTPTVDPYFQNTTLLLPGNQPSGVTDTNNNVFKDSSANNFTITRNPASGPNAPTQGTFTPFSKVDGRWGNYFDGSSKITTPSSADFGFGTGDFHISFWAYLVSDANKTFFGNGTDNLNLYVAATTKYIGLYTGSTNDSTTVAPLNQWVFFVVTRTGSTLQVYLNNTSVLSISNSTNFSTTSFAIGSNISTSYINSYISNFKIVKGVAWTPAANPTSPSTADANTKLLTCQSNRFIDNSANAFAFTVTGSPSIQTFSPFPTTASYDASVNGGSGYFDGTSDFLSAATNAAFNFGSGAFTIEFWYYPTTLSGTQCLITNYGGSTTGFVIQMGGSTAGSGRIDAGFSGDGADITSTNALRVSSWNHIAISGTPGATGIKLFINGAQEGSTYTGATSLDTSSTLLIGEVASTNRLSGYLCGLRLLKGTAQYTTTFTPPTTPPTAITNTSLLLNFTNGAIIDNTMSNDLETVGGAAISTTQSKFGGSSISFPSNDSYLLTNPTTSLEFGSGDFTIEFWWYPTSTARQALYHGSFGADWSIGIDYSSVSTNQKIGLWASSNGSSWNLINADAAGNGIGTITITQNAWNHIAYVRYGTTWMLFVNGVRDLNLTGISGSIASRPTYPKGIGVWWNTTTMAEASGYIDDLRITKGIARYVQNFTPPTSAFLTL
jgi:hypothetical protein